MSNEKLIIDFVKSLNFESSYQCPSAWIGHEKLANFLIKTCKPKTIVELGVHNGFSYFSFCQTVHDYKLETKCFGIDNWKGDFHQGFYDEKIYEEALEQNKKYHYFSELIRKDFNSASTNFKDHSIDFLHIDGYHTYDAVKNDFANWLPKCTKDALILFHDVNEFKDDFGVYKFFNELKQSYSHFISPHAHGLGVVTLSNNKNSIIHFLNTFDIQTNFSALLLDQHIELLKKKELDKNVKQQAKTITTLNQTLTQITEKNEQQATTIDTYKNEILNIKATRSWRITQPLRNIYLFRNKLYKLVSLYGIFKLKNPGFKGIVRLCILFFKFISSGGFENLKKRVLIYSESQSLNKKLTNFLPNYEFDPDSGISNIKRLNFYISNQTILNPVLIFDHDYGGGTNLYSDILLDKIIDEGDQVIRVHFKNSLWFIKWCKADDATIFATDKISDLFQAISKTNPSKIVINSFYGYSDLYKVIVKIIKLKRLTGIQLEIKVHDFHALCPSPHLLDFNNKYCAVPIDLSVCNQCLKKNVAWHITGLLWPENISKWRSAFSKLLHEATKIDFFDSSTVGIYKKIFNFSDEKISITAHNDNYFNVTLYPDTSGKLHLGLLGNLNIVKGLDIVNELSSYIKKNRLDIPITLIGLSMLPLDQGVTVVGNYETSDLPRLISEYKINVVFISSIVPETFSYTLSEAMKMKLPVICFDLGAQGNRVKNYDLGQVMPLNSTSKEILMASQALLKKAQNKNDASLHVYN